VKVHVEVSIDSSALFSRVLIKLGSYGLIRVYYYITYFNFVYFIYISILGIIFIVIFNFINIDLKVFIALSSIVYLNISILVIFINNYFSLSGFIFINIHHRFSSIIFFFIFGVINFYTKSRLIIVNSGVFIVIKSLNLLVFFILYFNLFCPITLGFLGELMILIIFFYYLKILFLFIGFVFMLGLIYNIFFLLRFGFMHINFCYLFVEYKVCFYLNYLIIFIFLSFFICIVD